MWNVTPLYTMVYIIKKRIGKQYAGIASGKEKVS